MSDSLWPHGVYPIRLLCPWDSANKNTEVGCHFHLQENFPTQESNPGLTHCRQNLPAESPEDIWKYLEIFLTITICGKEGRCWNLINRDHGCCSMFLNAQGSPQSKDFSSPICYSAEVVNPNKEDQLWGWSEKKKINAASRILRMTASWYQMI